MPSDDFDPLRSALSGEQAGPTLSVARHLHGEPWPAGVVLPAGFTANPASAGRDRALPPAKPRPAPEA